MFCIHVGAHFILCLLFLVRIYFAHKTLLEKENIKEIGNRKKRKEASQAAANPSRPACPRTRPSPTRRPASQAVARPLLPSLLWLTDGPVLLSLTRGARGSALSSPSLRNRAGHRLRRERDPTRSRLGRDLLSPRPYKASRDAPRRSFASKLRNRALAAVFLSLEISPRSGTNCRTPRAPLLALRSQPSTSLNSR